MINYLKSCLPYFLVVMMFMVGYTKGVSDSDTKWANKELKESNELTVKLHDSQIKLQELERRSLNDRATLESRARADIDKLTDDNKRLRIKVRQSESTAANQKGCSCPTIIDGRAEIAAEDGAALIAIAKEGDEWIMRLQDTINELQGGSK